MNIQQTTIFSNGHLFQGNSVDHSKWKTSMVVQGEEIVFIGHDDAPEIESYRKAGANVTDLNGLHVFPGFIDAHMHF
jgi:predicted amidohydrolase YtcJ